MELFELMNTQGNKEVTNSSGAPYGCMVWYCQNNVASFKESITVITALRGLPESFLYILHKAYFYFTIVTDFCLCSPLIKRAQKTILLYR